MDEPSLEQLPTKEPDLPRIIGELQQAQADNTYHLQRIEDCRGWWHCSWPQQTKDGRKHAWKEQLEVNPWDGASDSRLRIVDAIIDQHVTLAKTAFWNAKIQCRSVRPLVYGRQDKVAQKMLEWRIYTQMRPELLRELPLAFAWKYGFGISFIGVEWEQERAMSEVPVTMEDLAQAANQLNAPELIDMSDTEESNAVILDFLQSISEILDRDGARKILSELRNDGMSVLPIVNITVNKPVWRALLPCIDVMIPSETHDLQKERWVARRELVNETTLYDRIVTEGYDEDFVEEACKHKGEFSDFLSGPLWRYTSIGSERDLIELYHFMYKSVESGVPCLYRTIFNEASAGEDLFASHKVFEYKHQQYPFVALRRTHDHRALMSSHGIPEESYTDEMDIKVQQDGLTDRTDLIHNPPMLIPTLRAQGVRSQYGPRAIMPVLRPQDVQFPPLPPSDETPILVMQMVQQRLNERYGIFGNIDALFKTLRQRELAMDTMGEMELVVEQTLQLMQQYERDEDVQRVAGQGGVPFNVSAADIQGRYEITVTYDPKLSDIEYVKELVGLMQQAMQFNQAGNVKMDKLMSHLLGIIDPDAADLVEEDQQAVTEKERNDEKLAATQILAGIEPDFPQFGNHQLRLKTLMETTIQSPNPAVQQIIASRKDIQMLLKKRIKNHQNQIQQYQVNPQIGRSLATKAFAPNQPAELMQ